MPGLLDFIGTPEGQGLLSAAFGGLAGARKGTPFNNLGRAGVSGIVGYNQARDQDGELDQRKQRQQLFEMQLKQLQQQQADAQLARDNEAKFRASIASPQQSMLDSAMADGQGPTMANAAKLAPVDPRDQQLWQAMSLGQIKTLEYVSAITKNRTPLKLSEGDVLVDPNTFQPLAKGAPKAGSQPSAIAEYQFAVGQGYKGNFEDWKQSQRPPGTTINLPRNELGLSPKDRFDMEQKLGADFMTRTKLDGGIISTAQDIGNILKQGGALKDQAAIYKFAKALDPDGAVREADYAAIVKTAGGLDYVKALFNKALTGEQLTPNQRTEMTNLTTAMASVAQKRMATAKEKFSKNAKLYQLNPDNIFQGIGDPLDDTWAIVPPPGR